MRHLRIYRAIRLIVSTGSIRKASEYIAISPSALNRSIQSFEQELGVEIFERIAGGVRLSVSGELLLRPMLEHLAQIDDFLALVSDMRGGTAGILRLSVSGDVLPDPLAPALTAYRARYPKVSVEVMRAETPRALLDHAVDLALVTLPLIEDGLEVALSHTVRPTGRVSARHPQANGHLDLSDVAMHTLVLPQPGSGLRAAVDVALRRHGVTPGGIMVFPDACAHLQEGPLPDLQIMLAPAPGDGSIAPVDVTGLRLGDVQLTLLRRSEGALPRTAAHFVAVLHTTLDAAS